MITLCRWGEIRSLSLMTTSSRCLPPDYLARHHRNPKWAFLHSFMLRKLLKRRTPVRLINGSLLLWAFISHLISALLFFFSHFIFWSRMICCAFARLILCRYIFVVFFFLFLWLFSKFDTRSIWMWKFSLARAVWAHDISDWKIRRINAITCRGITTFCTQPRAVWDEKYFCVSALEEFFALLEKCVRVCDTTALTWVSLFWVGKKSTYSQDNQHKQAKDKARELQLFLNGDNFWAENETLLLCHKWPTGLDFSSAQLYHLNRRRRRCLGLSSTAHIGGCRLSYFFLLRQHAFLLSLICFAASFCSLYWPRLHSNVVSKW